MIRALRRTTDPTASPPYLSHFKLREAPFAASSRAAFFYADPERAQTLNMLQHLTQYSEELLLVSGSVGSGKTMLLEQYLLRADDDWKICRISGADAADPATLFLIAARCFGLHTEGLAPESVLGALQNHLNQLQQSMLPVLVVDDAHLLSGDALEIVVRLAELPGDNGRLIRVLLFAEPQIAQLLAGERFAASARPHTLELRALDEGQTGAYLQHRLNAAGGRGALFQTRELRRIHKVSHGWPGKINEVAHEVLMDKQRAERPSRLKIIYVALALAVVAGAAYQFLLHGGADEVAHQPVPSQAGAAAGMVAAAEQPIVRADERPRLAQVAMVVRSGETLQITCAAPEPAAVAMPAPERIRVQEITPAVEAAAEVTVTPVADEPPAESPPAVEPVVVVPDMPVSVETGQEVMPQPAAVESVAAPAALPAPMPVRQPPVVTRVEPAPVPASRDSQTLMLHGSGFTPESRVTVAWAGRSKALSGSQVEVMDARRIAIQIVTGSRGERWTVMVSTGPDGPSSAPYPFQVAAPAVVAKPLPVAPVPAQPASGFRDAAWLWAQDPRRYTVQLVGATALEAIHSHLEGSRLPGDLALLVLSRDGGPWHVVLWGDFADRDEAQRAVARLPEPLRRNSPWIRTFDGVHQEMAAGNAGGR